MPALGLCVLPGSRKAKKSSLKHVRENGAVINSQLGEDLAVDVDVCLLHRARQPVRSEAPFDLELQWLQESPYLSSFCSSRGPRSPAVAVGILRVARTRRDLGLCWRGALLHGGSLVHSLGVSVSVSCGKRKTGKTVLMDDVDQMTRIPSQLGSIMAIRNTAAPSRVGP